VAVKALPDLLLAEWAAFGVLDESPVHGYEVARQLAPGGPLGQVWQVPRPLVYRALQRLELKGFIEVAARQPSRLGPNRRPWRVTPAGHRLLARWLQTPVEHVRDARSTLLLKLALIERRAADPTKLLQSQRAVFATIVDGLAEQGQGAEGFEATAANLRWESAQAVLRFVDGELARCAVGS